MSVNMETDNAFTYLDLSVTSINISNVNPDIFEYILMEITTLLVNKHFKQNFTIENIYRYISFIDNNIKNLDINNIYLI